jgi:hypothetical protein
MVKTAVMHSCLVLSAWTCTSASGKAGDKPGAFSSISESSLNRAWNDVTNDIVTDLKAIKIPGHKDPLLQIDDLQFADVTIGSAAVSVKPDEGVEIILEDMSNQVAPVHFCAGFPKKCCGQLWASATGQSFTGLNTVVLNETTGLGELHTTVLAESAGDIQIHHKMDTALCEAVADGMGLINDVAIGLVKTALQLALPQIVSKVVDTPGNLILGALENPPALGLGAEKFKLDNSFVSVDYQNHRITHYHKGEFKSTVNPKESHQTPPSFSVAADRDVELGFSDYVFNTLFESLKAEHIGETQIELPIHTPSTLKVCPDCPVVAQVKFQNPGECEFMGGKATTKFASMKFEIGLKTKLGVVTPAFTMTVDATASISFALSQPSGKAPSLKATFTLDSFSQKDVVFLIGKINTDDLNRDIEAILTGLLNKINTDLPALPILSLPGVQYENPSFVVDNHMLLVQADFVRASAAPSIVV